MTLPYRLILISLGLTVLLSSCQPQDRGHATPEAAEQLAQITNYLPEVGIDEILEVPSTEDIFDLVADFSVTPDAQKIASPSGISMLHLACLFKKPELARCLLLDKADPNAITAAGDTPLSLAVAMRGVEDESVTEDTVIALIDILIAGGADLNQKIGEDIPLINYAGLNSFSEKVFLYLLDKGCQPDETTCQAPAIMGWNTALQRMMGTGAADFPMAKETMLLMAAANLHTETVKLLLDAGADPDAKRISGTTPLLEAAGHLLSPSEEEETEQRKAMLDICALLIKYGADPDLAELRQDGSPAFSATDILTKDPATVNELEARGINLKAKEIEFTTGIALLEAVGKASVLEQQPAAEDFKAIASVLTPTEEMKTHASYHDVLPMAVELLHSINPAEASRHVASLPVWTGPEAWEKGHGECLLPAITKCENIILPKEIICITAEHLDKAGKGDSAALVIELLSRCPDATTEINHYCNHTSRALKAGALGARLRQAGLPTPRDGDVLLWLDNHERTADSPILQKAVLLTSLSRLWYGDMLPEEQQLLLAAMREIGAIEAASHYEAITQSMDDPEQLDKITENSDSWKFELEIATAQFILTNAQAFQPANR